MKLGIEKLNELKQIAIAAAKEAGSFIENYNRKNISVVNKSDNNITGESLASQVVTEVDQKCQEIILKHLNPTLNEYSLGLLTEESEDDLSRFRNDYFWCVDPLDGTLAYINNVSGYAVSIALVSKGGNSQLGIVYDPVEKILYHAIKGGGVYKNQITMQPLPTADSKTLVFYTDKSFTEYVNYAPTILKLKEIARKFLQADLEIIENGGAVLNACRVLENPFACYFKPPKHAKGGGSLWDFAATACLFEEFGAFVSTMFGEPIPLNQKNPFMNEQGVLYTNHPVIYKNIKKLMNY